MNKKGWLRIIVPAVVILALVGAVVLLVLSGSGKEKLTDRYSTAPELTGQVSPNAEKPC